eukprot:1159558-Pelagomonas_calceolata.AAC.1
MEPLEANTLLIMKAQFCDNCISLQPSEVTAAKNAHVSAPFSAPNCTQLQARNRIGGSNLLRLVLCEAEVEAATGCALCLEEALL